MKYRIKSLTEKDDDGTSLFWNNKVGWVSIGNSKIFTEKQRKTLHLPIGNCKWVEVGKEFPEVRHSATEKEIIKLVYVLMILEDARAVGLEKTMDAWSGK